jgi:hypothetical protein
MKLPPIPEESFDGVKESTEIKFEKCMHELYVVSANEVRCRKCSVGWTGQGVTKLLQTSK